MNRLSFSKRVKDELSQVVNGANHCRAAQRTAQALFTSKEKAYNIDKVPKRRCCRRAFLREAFILSGSMSDPGKGYHLEFSCRTKAAADALGEALSGFEIHSSRTTRGSREAVYLKDSEEIASLLNVMGAHVSLMEMENSRILRQMRGVVNRRVNCDQHNITRAVDAARIQIEAITYLEETGELKRLPASLRAAAKARKEAPDMALKELAEHMKPPLTKSGMNHRLQKIVQLAQLKKEDKHLHGEKKHTDRGRADA